MLRSILSRLTALLLLLAAVAPATAQDDKSLYKLGLVLGNDEKDRRFDSDVLDVATKAFVQSRRFDMVERRQLNAIFTEKDLQGFLGKGNNKLTDVLGLDLLGLVSYMVERQSSSGIESTVWFIEVRLVDTKTGRILTTLSSERSDLIRPPSTPRQAGDQLFHSVRDAFPPFGYIVKVAGNEVVVDLGTEAGLKDGDTLEVVREGEQIIHPKTGEVLSAEMVVVGELKVVSASAQLSSCKLKSAEAAPLGSTVRLKERSSILRKGIGKVRGVVDRYTGGR